jgi:hypothetical protein
MQLPRINPVGVAEVPTGYQSTPRRFSPLLRWACALILVVFALVTFATTVVSLGRYCLTSDGGNVQQLPLLAPSE